MVGKYSKENNKGSGFLTGLLVGLLVAAAVMAAVHYMPKLVDLTPPEASTSTQPTGTTQQSTQPSESAPEQTTPDRTEATSDICIYTPYCTLHYPAQWSQEVKILTDQTPEKFSVTVVGLIGEKEAALFAVVFGQSQEMPVGTLVCEDGTEVTVRLNLDLFRPDESWTVEELDRAYEMIDGSAYLMEALAELENFR